MSKFADEPMDIDTLDRVKALGPDAARVVKAYLRLEGALHRIEEWPEHEQHYPPSERYADFRDVASHAIQGGRPGEFVGPKWTQEEIDEAKRLAAERHAAIKWK